MTPLSSLRSGSLCVPGFLGLRFCVPSGRHHSLVSPRLFCFIFISTGGGGSIGSARTQQLESEAAYAAVV